MDRLEHCRFHWRSTARRHPGERGRCTRSPESPATSAAATARALRRASRYGCGPRPCVSARPGRRGADVVADFADRTALPRRSTAATAHSSCSPHPAVHRADHRSVARSIAAAVGERRPARRPAVRRSGRTCPRARPDPLAAPPGESAARDRRRADRDPFAALPGEGGDRARRAIGAGVYPVFGDSADVPVPMVATRDIGEAVANASRPLRPARSSTWRRRRTPSGRSPKLGGRAREGRCRSSPSPGPAG